MTFIAVIAFALFLVAVIAEPDLLNWRKPEALQVSRSAGRLLAVVMLVGLALMIATHFNQFLKTASE